MSQRWPWVVVAAGAYLAFVVSQFPAAAAVRWFAPAEFHAAGVQGTIWSGTAALASVPGLPMRELRWTLGGWPLFVGRLAGNVSARLPEGFVDSGYSGTLWRIGSGSVTLRNSALSTSFGALRDLLPVRGARGLMSLALDELVLDNGWPVGIAGSLRISGLAVEPFAGAGNTMIELGDYDIEFTGADAEAVTANVADAGGPLEVAGTVRLSRNLEYVLEGMVRERPDAQRGLSEGLAIMLPEPDENGWRPIDFPGSL